MGPEFLMKSEDSWPKRPNDMKDLAADDPEIKKSTEAFVTNTAEQTDDHINQVFKRFSSWTQRGFCATRTIYAGTFSGAKQANQSRIPVTKG